MRRPKWERSLETESQMVVERLISVTVWRVQLPDAEREKSGARASAVTPINPRRNVTICKNNATRGSRFDISVGARPGCTGIAGRAKSAACLRACVSAIKPAPSRGKVGGLPAGTKLISLSVLYRAPTYTLDTPSLFFSTIHRLLPTCANCNSIAPIDFSNRRSRAFFLYLAIKS